MRAVFLPYLLGLLTAFTLSGLGLFVLRQPDPPPIQVMPPPTPAPAATATPTSTPGPVVVYVSGAVAAPGTFSLPPGARVVDAIVAAGGLRSDAESALINQAERLFDGAQVHVPTVGASALAAPIVGLSGLLPSPTPDMRSGAALAGIAGGLIDLNKATQAELETLPGIGASKAQGIIANRPYATVDDLDRVPGIGAATLDRLRPLVMVQP
jgi:competence protein ComEA